ncbi:MAG: hypothetical protein ACKOET_03435, partial [Verrucomicrobiota bacterium]
MAPTYPRPSLRQAPVRGRPGFPPFDRPGRRRETSPLARCGSRYLQVGVLRPDPPHSPQPDPPNMRYIEPHGHMVSRTTDDYARMAVA